MTERIVSPTGRGFLLLDSHPTGCARTVADMVAQVPAGSRSDRAPVALVIGSSAGYGLATTIAGLVFAVLAFLQASASPCHSSSPARHSPMPLTSPQRRSLSSLHRSSRESWS